MNRKALLLVLVLAVVAAAVALSTPQGAKPVAPPDAPSPNSQASGGAPAAAETAPATAAPAAREPFTKAAECRACHEDLYAEWTKSKHGEAWTDPVVRALSNGFRMSECIDCHAPMPIHETGLGVRVAPRQHSRGDGVDCLTCHLMEDGVSVAATHPFDTSKVAGACKPVVVAEMSTPTACAGCHNQHLTVDELTASGRKETCSDCHMNATTRGASGSTHPGRSHAFLGAHSLPMLQKAVTFDLSVADGAVKAKVTNVGAAHHIPTDSRHRSYNLFLSAWDDHGNPLVADKMIQEFRLYYRDDFRPSTQIADGKTGEGSWPIPAGLSGKAKVRLVYALNPEDLVTKQHLTDVTEKEISFP